MASGDDEVSEIASINQNVLANAAGANDQPAIEPDINRIRADHNYNIDANRVHFSCVIPECKFVTQDCSSETIA